MQFWSHLLHGVWSEEGYLLYPVYRHRTLLQDQQLQCCVLESERKRGEGFVTQKNKIGKFLKALLLLNFFPCLLLRIWICDLSFALTKKLIIQQSNEFTCKITAWWAGYGERVCSLMKFVQSLCREVSWLIEKMTTGRQFVLQETPTIFVFSCPRARCITNYCSLWIVKTSSLLVSKYNIQSFLCVCTLFGSWLQLLTRGDCYSDIKPEGSREERTMIFASCFPLWQCSLEIQACE